MKLIGYYYRVVILYSFALIGVELVDISCDCEAPRVMDQRFNHVLRSLFTADSLTVFAPVSSAVENDLCRNHSLLFLDDVVNNKMWALRMLDASSKLPSGLLAGNVVHLGNYDECLSIQNVASEFGSFSGQHCMVTIGERSYVTEIDLIEKRGLEFDMHMSAGGVEKVLSRMSMLWSVCVPSSCEPRDVQQHLRTAMRTRLGNVSISVQDGACSSRASRKPLRNSDWGFIVFASVTGVLVGLSTIIDLTTWKSSTRKELILVFSLKLHLKRLLSVDAPRVNGLPVINGVKAISMLWVILLHNALFVILHPAINFSAISEYEQKAGWMSALITNGSLAVDSFLLVSGLLMCYNFLGDRLCRVEFSLPHYYLHRVIRIVPLYAVLRLCMVTVASADWLIEGGPFWGINTQGISNRCQEWVYSAMFLVNYQRPEDMCMGHSWYLSLDMQLFLLSPLILVPLWRRPVLGKDLLCFLTVVGVVISVGVAFVYKLQVNVVPDLQELGTRHYFPTHTRFTPWVIGVVVGYALHATKQLSTPRLTPSTVTFGCIVSMTLMTTSFFSINHFLRADYQYDRLSSSLYLGLFRPAWALGLGWVVFALSRGYGARPVKKFFSNHLFTVLSRLSYATYLASTLIMMYLFIVFTTTPMYFSAATLVPKFFTDLFASLVCGLVLHLLFEAPPIYIERLLSRRAKISQKEQ